MVEPGVVLFHTYVEAPLAANVAPENAQTVALDGLMLTTGKLNVAAATVVVLAQLKLLKPVSV